MNVLRFNFEDNTTMFAFEYNAKKDTFDKILEKALSMEYETQEYRNDCSFFDVDLKKYINNFQELIETKNIQLKNCNHHAQSISQELKKVIFLCESNPQSKSEKIDKKMLFDTKHYTSNEKFAEEFISNDGIKIMLQLAEITSGTSKTYCCETLNNLLIYCNALEYVNQNPKVFKQFYNILTSRIENPNLIPVMFKLFRTLIKNLDTGVDLFMEASKDYSKENQTQLYSELINFLKFVDSNVKEEVLETLVLILNKTSTKKELQSNLYLNLKDANLSEILQKNKSETKSNKYIEIHHKFQDITKDIVDRIDYEIEVYRRLVSKYEDQCQVMQIELDLVKKNRKFYIEMMEDFIQLKKIAEISKKQSLCFDFCMLYILKHVDTPIQRSAANIFSKENDENETEIDEEVKKVKYLKSLNEEIEILESDKINYLKEIEKLKEKLKDKSITNVDSLNTTNENYIRTTSDFFGLQGVLSNLNIQSVSESSVTQNVTSNPEVSVVQNVPSNPEVPSVPSIPSVPGIPPIPGVPGVPPIPGVPGVPAILGVPGIPPIPGVPGIPPIPGITGVPPIPGIPGVSGVPGIPGMPMFPPAIQPNKPKIILKEKVKQMAWKRIINTPNSNMNFWSNLKEVSISQDQIVPLFSAKSVIQQVKKVVTQAKGAIAEKHFLNDKRIQSVGITIAKLPPVLLILEALESMDNKILTKTNIESLVREYITTEEIEAYKAQNEPGLNWGKGEKFLIGIHRIPFSKEKLNVWYFLLNFEDEYPIPCKAIEIISKACDEVKSSKHFSQILAYIVTIGNILNSGTDKGQADGFNLDFLSKITSIKDNKGRNVLQLICNMIQEKHNTFNEISKDFVNVQEASMILLGDTKANVNSLVQGSKEALEFMKKIIVEDSFKKKAQLELFGITKKLDSLKVKMEDVEKKYKDIVLFYGYSDNESKYQKSDEFFKVINSFIKEVDKCLPTIEPEKSFKRKHVVGKKIVDEPSISVPSTIPKSESKLISEPSITPTKIVPQNKGPEMFKMLPIFNKKKP